MNKVATFMHYALLATLITFISSIVILSLHYMPIINGDSKVLNSQDNKSISNTFIMLYHPTIKGGNQIMAEDKSKPASPTSQPVNTKPVHESFERNAGNTVAKASDKKPDSNKSK